MRSTVRPAVIAAAVAVALGLSACGGVSASSVANSASSSSSSSSEDSAAADTSSDTSSTEVTDESSSSDSQTVKIGVGKSQYTDGLIVNISTKMTNKKIGQYAAGGKAGDNMIVFTVQLDNQTSAVFDPALLGVKVSYGDAGDQAEQVYDDGTAEGFTAKIPAKRKAQAKFGFAVPKAEVKNLTIEVSPDFTHESVLFVS